MLRRVATIIALYGAVSCNPNRNSQPDQSKLKDTGSDGEIDAGVFQAKSFGKQLFVEGTLTDSNGRVWAFKTVPGAKSANDVLFWGWRTAGQQFGNLLNVETYTVAAWGEVKRGGAIAKTGFKDVAFDTGIVHYGGEFFRDGWEHGSNAAVDLWNFRFFDAGAEVVTGTGTVAWDAVAGVFTVAGGAVYGTYGVAHSVVAPAIVVAWQPVSGIMAMIGPGAVVPGAMYVWNGISWGLINVQYSVAELNTPRTPDGRVLYVYDFGANGRPLKTRSLNVAAVEDIALASLYMVKGEQAKKPLEARLAQLAQEIIALEMKKKGLEDSSKKVDEDTRKKASVIALDKLMSDSFRFDKTTLDKDAKQLVVDAAAMRRMVEGLAASAKLKLTEAEKVEAVAKMKKNLDALVRLLDADNT